MVWSERDFWDVLPLVCVCMDAFFTAFFEFVVNKRIIANTLIVDIRLVIE